MARGRKRICRLCQKPVEAGATDKQENVAPIQYKRNVMDTSPFILARNSNILVFDYLISFLVGSFSEICCERGMSLR